MSDIDNNLAAVLETDNQVVAKAESTKVTVIPENDINKDFDYARMTHYELIEKGNEALDGILEVAKESQHPRAYEVAGNMIKNLSDMTDKLLLLQKQRKELDGTSAPAPQQVHVDKAVFVGSTAELLKQVKHANTRTDD